MKTTSEVYIEGTADDPAVRSRTWLDERNRELLSAAGSKTALLTELRLAPEQRQAAQASLLACCTDRIQPHLAVLDSVLYAQAAGATQTRQLVRALRIQHRIIDDHVHALATADTAQSAAAAAHSVVTVLATCVEIQRELLLPALAALPGADLPALAHDVDTLLGGGELDKPDVLDVREIPHGRRHPRIFGIYARLAEGESFVLVNNHDPKPLRREFEATYPDQFGWDYLENGPTQWRVRISRTRPPA